MSKKSKGFVSKLSVLAAATAAALTAMPAQAYKFDTGNSDISVNWDNTVKVNLANRVSAQDPHITSSPNYNDGDLNFDKGQMTSERLDLFSAFDFSYQHKMGFRVSGAAWYDAAYNNLDNPNPTPNHLVNGKPALGLSDYTDRYAHGASGELLEAYAFSNFDIGTDQKLNVTAGKSLQVWGSGTQTLLHGIDYGQFAMDLGKLFTIPRNEQKEVYLPRNQLTADYVVSPEWKFGAQYYLDWEHSRFPEAGSYLGMYDLALNGGESAYLPGGLLAKHGKDLTPDSSGDYGLYAKWSPSWLGGTLGLFYRNTSDTLPDSVILNPVTRQYSVAFAQGIDIYGLSLNKDVAGTKLAVDLSYRENMPLNSQPFLTIAPAKAGTPGFIAAMPKDGDTGGAYGNTLHLAINDTKVFGKTALFDRATVQAELTWNRLVSVTSGYAQYRGNPAYTGIDRSTKDFFGINLFVAPAWTQVFTGVDLSMPTSFSDGLKGESAVPLGGNQHTGNWSTGLTAMVKSKYEFSLKYTSFFGPYRTAANGTITSYAGLMSLLSDRDTVSLTFKTTF
ncbi:DUF1302 domain-containing protein [Silvimonas soli]|uniref:DUF1302 domain-containing protein n=1 Tax=Silvimonas soli TaxID=2980100 RepID=UPI0024B38D67|nr:DUF1302 family protein [Silvimonas soli]